MGDAFDLGDTSGKLAVEHKVVTEPHRLHQVVAQMQIHPHLTAARCAGDEHHRQLLHCLDPVDVEGEHGIPEAEHLCSAIKTAKNEQLVAFVCNWRVAILTDCPDEIVRTEFDPAAFVAGVKKALAKN